MAAKESEPPIIPTDVGNAKTREKLMALLREQAEVAEMKRAAEERKRDIDQQIHEIMGKLGHKSILAPNHEGEIRHFSVVQGANVTIKEKLLLQNGVSPMVIEQSKERTEYTYVSSREVSEKYTDLAESLKAQLRKRRVA